MEEALTLGLRDNVKARRLQPDGTYLPVDAIGPEVRSQAVLLDTVRRVGDPKSEPLIRHVAAPAAEPAVVETPRPTPVAAVGS
jgi:polyphosphate kinase